MRKFLSAVLITVMLLSAVSCAEGGIKFGKEKGTSAEHDVITVPDANAESKKTIKLTFCQNISRLPFGKSVPEGWYVTDPGTNDFLDAYKNDPLYSTVPEEHRHSGYKGFFYLLIDDHDVLSNVVSSTKKYTVNDVYNSDVLDNYFIIAIERYSSDAMMNFTFYTVEFDRDTKVLTITQDIEWHNDYSNGTGYVSTALDLVPVERSVLGGVPLSEVTTVYKQAPRSFGS